MEADAETVWKALMDADLLEVGRRVPMVGVLGACDSCRSSAATSEIPAGEGGWVLLGERPREEIALGLVGKFWRPVIEFANVSPEGFRNFAQPGYAKTVRPLRPDPLEPRRSSAQTTRDICGEGVARLRIGADAAGLGRP